MSFQSFRQKFFCLFNTQHIDSFRPLFRRFLSVGYLLILLQHNAKVKATIKNTRFKKLNNLFKELENQLPKKDDVFLDLAKRLGRILLFILSCKQLINECHTIKSRYPTQKFNEQTQAIEDTIQKLTAWQKIYWSKLEELTHENTSHLTDYQKHFFKLIDELIKRYNNRSYLETLRAFIKSHTSNSPKPGKEEYRAEALIHYTTKLQNKLLSTSPTNVRPHIGKRDVINRSLRFENLYSILLDKRDKSLLTLLKKDQIIQKHLDRYPIYRRKKDIYEIEAQLHPRFLSKLCNQIEALLYRVMDVPSQSNQYDKVGTQIMKDIFGITPTLELDPSEVPKIGGLSVF